MTLAAYAAIYLIWGSTFLAIRLAIDSIPPLMMMGLRCTAAGGLMLAWAALHGERASWRAWGHGAVAGALMFGCAYGALAWAEERIASGIAALFVATLPFWLAVFEYGRRRTAPSPRMLAGLLIGLAGVALLVVRGAAAAENSGGPYPPAAAVMPALVIVLGEIAWAAGSLYAQPPRLPQSLALRAGMPLAAGGALLLGASWIAREFQRFNPHAVSARSLTALAYLIVFGSIVAFSAYAWLMRVQPPTRVATHAYVNPVIAVALGSMAGGEPFTPAIGVASAVIAGGVALVLGVPWRAGDGGEPCSSRSTKPFEDRRGTVRRYSDRCVA